MLPGQQLNLVETEQVKSLRKHRPCQVDLQIRQLETKEKVLFDFYSLKVAGSVFKTRGKPITKISSAFYFFIFHFL